MYSSFYSHSFPTVFTQAQLGVMVSLYWTALYMFVDQVLKWSVVAVYIEQKENIQNPRFY